MTNGPDAQAPKFIKRILCLANSRKHSGRCIAGQEIVNQRPGGWIRPVSARQHQEVSEQERNYEDGSDPKVLDVMDVPLIEPRPSEYQQENWVLDQNRYWRRAGRLNWSGLQVFLEPTGPLWLNQQNSYAGLNDRVKLGQAATLRSSLRLIHVNRLALKVFSPGSSFGNIKRRVQGQFLHEGIRYHLWVTDPAYERRYLAMPDGTHELDESCIAISLGEPYEGHAYKLIAAVIERKDNEGQ